MLDTDQSAPETQMPHHPTRKYAVKHLFDRLEWKRKEEAQR